MARKQASGSARSPTQSERRQLNKEKAVKTTEEDLAASEQALEDEKRNKMPELPRAPQERLLIWIYKFYKENMTASMVVESGILGLSVQQAYLKYFPDLETDTSELNLLISVACGLIANFFAFFVIFKSRDILPPWNTIYLLFLPILLSFIYNKDLLLFNTAFTMCSLELPDIVKFFIQFTVIGSNDDYGRDPKYNSQVIATHMAINYALSKVSAMKSWDKVENNLFSILIADLFLIKSDQIHVIILQKLFLAFTAALLVVYAITTLIKANTIFRSLLVIIGWTGTFVILTKHQLDPLLGGDCLQWLYNFVMFTNTRIQIISIWLASLLLLIPTIFNYKIKLSSNSRRKIWHFLVLILLAYPLYVDLEFVQVCLAGSLILFLTVETIRYLKLYPLGDYLDSSLREFADFRDERGPVIISYIYLFMGISLPILFNGNPIGLIVLGVGDSLASIIGSNFGLIKWGNSNKTVEGTFAFILATFAVSAVMKLAGLFFFDKSYHALFVTCTLSGILEGNSNMNDNIMIPGFMMVLLECLKSE